MIACLLVALSAPAQPPIDLALLETGVWIEDPLGEPVIDRGPSGAWDHVAVDNPFVLADDGRFLCYFEAENAQHQEQISVAVSTDLRTWTKVGDGPALPAGPPGAWDHMAAKLPVVGRHRGRYQMLYTGKDGAGHGAIGRATSTNGCAWTKVGDGPLLPGRPGSWDPILTTCPSLVKADGRFHAIYRGMTGFYENQQLGLMASRDLERWRRPKAPLAGLSGIDSLAVCSTPVEGTYVALSQKAHADRYYLSSDLRHWRPGPEARFYPGPIDTPSAPILHDGELWILYEKRDRIHRARLAPATELPPDAPAGEWVFDGGLATQAATGHEWSIATLGPGARIEAGIRGTGGTGWVGLVAARGQGFYCFAVVYDGRDIARLFRTTAGEFGETDWLVDVPFAPGAEHRLALSVVDGSISCGIDGATVITMRDSDPLPPGEIGLFTAGASAEFVDLVPEGILP